jgi:hypothetical protein
MERARSVRGSDWFASMDAMHGHLTAEEMTPQAGPGRASVDIHAVYSKLAVHRVERCIA